MTAVGRDGVSTGTKPDDKSTSNSAVETREWVGKYEPKELRKMLDRAAAKLEVTRERPSKYSVRITIIASIVIFVGVFVGIVSTPIDQHLLTNIFQASTDPERPATLAEKLQLSLIISVSGGVVPGIAYVIFRDKEEQQKNKELEAISHEIRHIRSKILVLKQEKAAESLRERNE